jgi:aspartyl-tRNA(Asn)/glutamyl-tRNA(Gln) amidotransferase subunit C
MPETPIETLRRTAALARLELTEQEALALAPQFEAILEHFEALTKLDVEDVEPTLGATTLEDVKRADEPRPSLSREAALSNAPDARDGFFGVPKTIQEEGS